MNVIGEIKARLDKHSGVRYQSGRDFVSIPPQDSNGFAVRLDIDRSGFIVSFDGWHEPFANGEDALDCFAWGLSDACSLEVEFRGGMETKWIVQSLEDGSWVSDSEVGLIVIPFWLRKKIVHRQNHLIQGT